MAIVPIERTTPARTQTTGMNQRLELTVEAFPFDTGPEYPQPPVRNLGNFRVHIF